MPDETAYQRYYEIIRMIPAGKVATYGQIAALAGLPGNARQVGYGLHDLPQDSDVPWQRVINSQGRVSPRSSPGWEDFQRQLLIDEGVVFNASGKVDLERFGWEPEVRMRHHSAS